MRTDKEKYEFAIRCREIEKEGGDVLDFIRREWPSYTPRGTWINIQKHILHRKQHEIKDGLPKEAIDVSKFEEIANAMRAQPDINGEELRALMESFGYTTDPGKALANVKQWAKKNDPECFAIISPMVMRSKKTPPAYPLKKRQTAPKAPVKEEPKEAAETPAEAEKPVTDTENEDNYGGGYMPPEDLANDIFGKMLKEGKITTCCAPAKPSGVTVPDEIPEEVVEYNGKEYERAEPEYTRIEQTAEKIQMVPITKDDMVNPAEPEKKRKKPRTIEIETDLGSYRKEEGKIVFRREDDNKDYNNKLAMIPDQWRQLADEIEDVLAMLDYIEE